MICGNREEKGGGGGKRTVEAQRVVWRAGAAVAGPVEGRWDLGRAGGLEFRHGAVEEEAVGSFDVGLAGGESGGRGERQAGEAHGGEERELHLVSGRRMSVEKRKGPIRG